MENRTKIQLENLNVFYQGRKVLKDISFSVPDTGITVIIGPSGCGKTTLLKTLNRLTDMIEGALVTGKIMIDGQDIHEPGTDVSLLRKKVGMLLQKPVVFPMSISENVAYGPLIHQTSDQKKISLKVRESLLAAGLIPELENRLSEPAGRLSAGQQQRLCLARLIANDPEIILCDEPTSALDPVSSGKIEENFLRLGKKIPVVLVTHILRQAKRLADHVIFIYQGEIIEQGLAEKIFTSPDKQLTRDYLAGAIL